MARNRIKMGSAQAICASVLVLATASPAFGDEFDLDSPPVRKAPAQQKRDTRGRRPASYAVRGQKQYRGENSSALKFSAGLGMGALSSLYTVGGDYLFPIGRTLSGIIGGSYSFLSANSAFFSYSMITVDAGALYQHPLSKDLMLEAAARAGVAIATVSSTLSSTALTAPSSSSSAATTTSASASTTSIVVTPTAGLSYALSKSMRLGGEVRLPLFLTSAGAGSYTGILATLRYGL